MTLLNLRSTSYREQRIYIREMGADENIYDITLESPGNPEVVSSIIEVLCMCIYVYYCIMYKSIAPLIVGASSFDKKHTLLIVYIC